MKFQLFSSVFFSLGSIVVTFDVNGAIEDMDAAVTAILTQLQNGLTVMINGNEYPSQNHLRIDGEDKWEDNVDVRKVKSRSESTSHSKEQSLVILFQKNHTNKVTKMTSWKALHRLPSCYVHKKTFWLKDVTMKLLCKRIGWNLLIPLAKSAARSTDWIFFTLQRKP